MLSRINIAEALALKDIVLFGPHTLTRKTPRGARASRRTPDIRFCPNLRDERLYVDLLHDTLVELLREIPTSYKLVPVVV